MPARDKEEHTQPKKANVRMQTPAILHTPAELNREFVRAPNEDDDGYDPYSDRQAHTPLFERDPWV